MTCKTVAELLIDLGVAKSHSRPKTSNDNPHVEASLKYCPAFASGGRVSARTWASRARTTTPSSPGTACPCWS